jgi:hypothetical protein
VLAVAHAGFVAAEVHALALAALFVERGRSLPVNDPNRLTWLRAAEAANTAYRRATLTESSPAAIAERATAWRALLDRLRSDPTATSG